MKCYLIFFSVLVFSCTSNTKKPSLEEANELLNAINKSDTIWVTFPKRLFVGGDGQFVVQTDRDEKNKQILQAGEQAGIWEVLREEEGTGEFFFSVEKRNFYKRIQPVEGYEYLFFDNPNNSDEWKLLLSTQENGRFTDIRVKREIRSGKSYYFPIGIFEVNVEKSPLYDIFRPSNATTWYPYCVFQRVDGKWTIASQGSMNEYERESLFQE